MSFLDVMSGWRVQHVLLFKEHRIYNQLFGDLPQGNGDPKYLMYGRPITPNHHALAEQYVLCDNCNATGAISLVGHQWLEPSSAAITSSVRSPPRRIFVCYLSDALDVSPAGVLWLNPNCSLIIRFGGILCSAVELQPATQPSREIDENDLNSWRFYWDAYQANRWKVSSAAVQPWPPSVDMWSMWTATPHRCSRHWTYGQTGIVKPTSTPNSR